MGCWPNSGRAKHPPRLTDHKQRCFKHPLLLLPFLTSTSPPPVTVSLRGDTEMQEEIE